MTEDSARSVTKEKEEEMNASDFPSPIAAPISLAAVGNIAAVASVDISGATSSPEPPATLPSPLKPVAAGVDDTALTSVASSSVIAPSNQDQADLSLEGESEGMGEGEEGMEVSIGEGEEG
jgi:hypothetical protein